MSVSQPLNMVTAPRNNNKIEDTRDIKFMYVCVEALKSTLH